MKHTHGSCPICGKPTHPDHRPFCSARCKQVDLGRWFSGAYSIPVVDREELEDLEAELLEQAAQTEGQN